MKRSTFLTSHEVSEGLSRLAAREGLSVSAFAVRELAETALRAGNARCWANLRISTRRRRWGGWAQLGLRRFAAVGLLAGIWELHDNLTAHDATYVALAEALGCELVTADAPTRRCPRTNLRDQGNPTLRWPAGAPAARADVVTPGRYELASRDRASTSISDSSPCKDSNSSSARPQALALRRPPRRAAASAARPSG